MATQDLKITVLIDNVPSQRMTAQLEPIFKAFALGKEGAKIDFIKEAADVLAIGAKIRVTGGTADDHVIVKSQMDAINTALSGSISALAGRMEMAEDDIDTLDGRATALEGRATALEGRADTLETDVGTLQTDMSTLQGDMSALTTLVGGYEGRISTLETDVAAIYANTPKEARFVATPAQTIFDVTGFSFDADNAVQDIELWIDGRRQIISLSGDFSDGSWRKNSTTQVETAEGVLEGKTVVVWKQGTSSGSGGGGGGAIAVKDEGTTVEGTAVAIDFVGAGVTVDRPSPGQARITIPGGAGSDLENITVDPQPSTAGGQSLGSLAKPWGRLVVKDTDNADVWEIKVSSGVLMAVKLN